MSKEKILVNVRVLNVIKYMKLLLSCKYVNPLKCSYLVHWVKQTRQLLTKSTL